MACSEPGQRQSVGGSARRSGQRPPARTRRASPATVGIIAVSPARAGRRDRRPAGVCQDPNQSGDRPRRTLRRAWLAAATHEGDAQGEFSIRHRTGTWRDPLRRRLLALADMVSISLALAVVAATGGFSLRTAFWTALLLPLWLVL